ncbi:MAG: hypothetical protein JOY70_02860 [Acidisphaera sp.]|nr:hypothetical protein [Acidisphaera sp.]
MTHLVRFNNLDLANRHNGSTGHASQIRCAMNQADLQLQVLRDYAAGLVGTRKAIRRAGIEDYADLVIALAQHDLSFPDPANTPERQTNLARASAILQPLCAMPVEVKIIVTARA